MAVHGASAREGPLNAPPPDGRVPRAVPPGDPDGIRDLFEEIRASLAERPRRLPPKLFYDATGARLFEEITRLPEYYLTRTEMGILDGCLGEVAALAGPGARVVEFGSGSGEKTERLLAALDRPATFVAIDIAAEQLDAFVDRVRRDHPELEVTGLAADYTRPFRLPPSIREEGTTLFFFPGSTIGNFEPEEARVFLNHMVEAGGPDSALVLGADRVKPRRILEPAYDDAAGVTAEFNRNGLRNLNALLGGDFDPDAFEHHAPWNADASRIEMRLVSRHDQTATLDPGLPGVDPLRVELARGEPIVTEHSYKFTPESLGALCRAAGWRVEAGWSDPDGWFGVHYLVPA